jgi:site-specific recombinase XerD
MTQCPLPLFDNLANINRHEDEINTEIHAHKQDFKYTLRFLQSYVGSQGTFNSYRREIERLLHWSWSIKKVAINKLKKEDIEEFIHFCQNPPKNWIGTKKVPKFLVKEGLRVANSEWRPFVVTLSKSARRRGDEPDIDKFSLSPGAIQETFAILSTYFNYLIGEEYILANPVALVRQKSKFLRKRQGKAQIRRLSNTQWEYVLKTVELMAEESPEKHERTRFMLSCLFGMYLRISELAASPRWQPKMNDFHQDGNGYWWFTTVGKGNKERQIAVSDEMLSSLKRWRTYLGLSPLPSPADSSPLLPKIKGYGGLSDTAPIRRIIQECFDRAIERLRRNNLELEADNLSDATVHWLRHTGISEDVKSRPREHVRDDAGHSSSATTDRYIDVELEERYLSAQPKKISRHTSSEKES